jgi:mRNA-degrading endonuclease RelE of RelBE toxin-antitoxin system
VKTKIRVEAQVEAFVKSLAPDPRRRLRLAIRGLANGRGDIKSLEGNLADYCRLSVTGYRVIYKERSARGVRVIDCVFAERRALVYEIFVRLLTEQAVD